MCWLLENDRNHKSALYNMYPKMNIFLLNNNYLHMKNRREISCFQVKCKCESECSYLCVDKKIICAHDTQNILII